MPRPEIMSEPVAAPSATGSPLHQAGRRLLRWTGPAALVSVGLVAYYFFTALTLIVLARRLLPVEVGQYTATLALVSLAVVLPNLGLDTWLLAQSGLAPAQLATTWRRAMQLRLALLTIWALLLLGVARWLPGATYPPPVVITVIVATALESLAQLTIAALRSQQHHRQVAWVQAIWAAAILAATLLLPLQPGRLLWFTSARMVITGAVLLWLVLGMVARPMAAVGPSWRALLNDGRAYLLSDAAALIYLRADLVLVGLLLGSVASAIYAPALSVLSVAYIVPSALFYAAVPRLTHTFAQTPAAFVAQARQECWRQVAVGLLLTAGLWLGAPLLTWLYGPDYAPAVGILRLLAPIGLLRSLNFALAAQLIAIQRQARRGQIQVAVAAFAVVANLLVMPRYGVAGVALVFVASELLLCLGYVWLAQPRRLHSA